jgi:hypothetical protein
MKHYHPTYAQWERRCVDRLKRIIDKQLSWNKLHGFHESHWGVVLDHGEFYYKRPALGDLLSEPRSQAEFLLRQNDELKLRRKLENKPFKG